MANALQSRSKLKATICLPLLVAVQGEGCEGGGADITAPIAAFESYSGVREFEVQVHASSSWDPYGSDSKLRFRWDWQSDGTWDTRWSRWSNASHTYPVAGVYQVTLEVKDGVGLRDEVTGTVRAFAQSAGSLIAWGNFPGLSWDSIPNGAPAGSDISALALGDGVALALLQDGSIAAWGSNSGKVVGRAPSGAGFRQISCSLDRGVALAGDGNVHLWGSAGTQVLAPPPGREFVQVTAGRLVSHALLDDGSILSRGSDQNGQITGAPTGGGFLQVEAGNYASYALRSDGGIVAWGTAPFGEVSEAPTQTGFRSIVAGHGHSVAALHEDGSIHVWGDGLHVREPGSPANPFVQIDYGGPLVALRADGSVKSWGFFFGLQDPPGKDYTQVAAGVGFLLAF